MSSTTTSTSSRHRKTLQLVLVVVAALVLVGNFVLKSLGDDVAPAEGAEGSALATLETLTVQDAADDAGYDRESDFGTAWQDVDDNGCDTRNDMLQRDLEDFELSAGDTCQVASGTLDDPYTGATIEFERGPRSGDVQIDHVVALKNAWITGAADWDKDKRVQIANDPLNLVASDGPANMGKGAKDAAQWLPDNQAYRCEYVARQIAVKAKYGLWVTPAERDAMTDVLTTCPSEPLPAS
ncbi:HNH endonuclease family protein [Promicromonospora citrea]|uniref:Deoxyribonuclease n=1 Tax=Promicromonospora citrea TaxID=43677 RepID=A0A8H9GL45_9MICO|nr:HNH endonuclease family protein [Promicromonospora citrea]NNH53275.1 HNH endonuclease [Promicromonospora citrea]GGM37108.1 deoxyribonuclease [Promicromonospora citrea]